MTLKQSSGRVVIVAGLFAFAAGWVSLMGLLAQAGAGSRARAGAPPRDDGSVKASVELLERDKFNIQLSLKVTDRDGKVLGGLAEQDIEVYEDGEPVTSYKKFMPAGQGPVRVALVLDYSRSMNGPKLRETQKAARGFIRMLRDQNDYLGLYLFNDPMHDRNALEKVPMGPLDLPRREQAWEAIMFTPLADGSPLLSTMEKGLAALEKVNGRRAMVVLTDGMDTGEPDEVARSKKAIKAACRDSKIPLHMVNMSTDAADRKTLEELAEATDGRYYHVPTPDQLKDIFKTIGETLQNVYTVAYESPNPVEDGLTRKVSVTVRSGGSGTQTAAEYHVPGVLSTGGRSNREAAPLAAVFFSLAGGLGLLYAAPYVARRRRRAAAEEPAEAPAPVKPARPSAQGVAPTRPSAQGIAAPRPSAQGNARRPSV